MKYGIIKVKLALLNKEKGDDVVDELIFKWSVM